MTLTFADFSSRRYAAGGALLTSKIFQPVGGVLAYLGSRVRVSPNHITLASLATGIAGSVALLSSDVGLRLTSMVLMLLSYALDCADGQLARATNKGSRYGAYLDVLVDLVVVLVFTIALSDALESPSTQAWALASAAMYGCGRVAIIFTATRLAQEEGRRDSSPKLWNRGYSAITDTPVGYVIIIGALTAGLVPLFVVAGYGFLSIAQALYASRRLH